ncbi:MATE family efflux transporter [Vibrio algicola]|uniref:Uncharacterized protein n=1 Tax=Vibrio algicola TaxID=2662262 RepID=A0A5Q0TBE3_9VIBR|nr:polysaccharide biosynthesis C-terminal domain-containing protein [Vibrio algicola]
MIVNVIMTIISRIITVSGSLLLSIFVANKFGPLYLGYFSLSLVILNGVNLLNKNGFDVYYIKHGFDVDNELMRLDLFFTLCFKLLKRSLYIVLLIALLGGAWVYYDNSNEVISNFVFLLLALPFFSMAYLFSAFYKASQKPSIACLFEIGSISMLTVLMTYFYSCTMNVFDFNIVSRMFFLSSVLVSIIGIYSVFFKADKRLISLNKNHTYSKRETNDFLTVSILGYIQVSMFTYICSFMLSGQDLGVFKAIEKVALVISFVLVVINSILMPKFSFLYRKKEIKKLENLMQSGVKICFILTLPYVLFVLFFPNTILSIFGNGFSGHGIVLNIMCLAQWFNVILGSVGSILNMTGHQRDVKNISFFIMCVMLLIAPVAIYKYQLFGAALAYLIYLSSQNILLFLFVYKRLKISPIPLLFWRSRCS